MFTIDEAKKFIQECLKSRTIMGILAAAVAFAAQKLFGTALDAEASEEVAVNLVDIVGGVVEALGLGVAAYGRIKAKGPITTKTTTTGALVLLGIGLLAPAPAWASDGLAALSAQLLPTAGMYLGLAIVGLFVVWLLVDKLILRGFSTAAEILTGNRAVAQFAGCVFIAAALLVGLALG